MFHRFCLRNSVVWLYRRASWDHLEITPYTRDLVMMALVGPDQSVVNAGMVLSDPVAPFPVAVRFQAGVVVFNIYVRVPIKRSFPVILHYGSTSVSEQATVKKLVSLLNRSSEVIKYNPHCLTGSCSAVVEIAAAKAIPVELYRYSRELGRIMLRPGGYTIGAGMVIGHDDIGWLIISTYCLAIQPQTSVKFVGGMLLGSDFYNRKLRRG